MPLGLALATGSPIVLLLISGAKIRLLFDTCKHLSRKVLTFIKF
jgi:hypothetical protein